MIDNLTIMLSGIILVLAFWIMFILRLYKKQEFRANLLQEQLDIKRQIERGNIADKMLWKYHNVTYLDHIYNIKVKNLQTKPKRLVRGE